jgi:nucleoside-diphosphate-sugar epimerase
MRTQALVRALARRSPPRSFAYGSTSGVYGDCAGARVDESRPLAPSTPRAQRRVDAEALVHHFGRTTGTRTSVLRIPGIYAPDRAGGTPRERLLRGTPVLQAQDDVYTNHIHSDDLARATVAALWRGRPQRAYNVSDDSELKTRDTAQSELPLMLLSFMGESRRLVNRRLKQELRSRLRYPTVREGLTGIS